MDYLISIDIGTTSTKALAFSPSAAIISQYSLSYELLHPQTNFSEQNPDEIFGAVVSLIQKIQKDSKNQGKLLGISFSSAMHSLLCVDKKGKTLTNLIIWADNRSATIAEDLRKTELGQKVYAQSGTPIHAMSPLPKILWLKKYKPEIFGKTHKFIGIKEYVFFRFFGKYLIDYSLASATGLLDNQSLQWNQSALDLLGIDKDKFSDLVSVFHIENQIKYRAEKLNIPQNTPFIIGGSDGCLANLGAGAIQSNSLTITIGTSGAVRTCISKPLADKQMRTFCYLLTEEIYVLGGAMNNGGIVMEWLSSLFFPQLNSTNTMETLSSLAQKSALGAEGLIFLPYLLGERSPIFNANAKGVFFGLELQHKQAHFVRAVMEGITLAIYSIGKTLMENNREIELIYANGGFAHSPFWVQMLADVFGKKVLLTETVESSAFGAAIIGWKALGRISNLNEVEKFIKITQIFEPDWEKHQSYIVNFAKFERLYQKLKDEF